MYRGDYAIGGTVGGDFNTSVNSVATTLSGTPNINVYKRGSSTPSTAGRTLNVDVNSVTGLNSWVIDTSSDGTFYVAGDYDVCLSAGTVGGVSRVGAVVGSFSLAQAATYTRIGAPAGASVSADIAAIKAELPQRVTKNTALAKFMFFMVSSTDHVTGKTGLTVTATRSIDGAAFASCANSATEIATGWYYIDLASTDLNGNVIALNFTGTGADVRAITIITQPA